jgi:hypothetical protein
VPQEPSDGEAGSALSARASGPAVGSGTLFTSTLSAMGTYRCSPHVEGEISRRFRLSRAVLPARRVKIIGEGNVGGGNRFNEALLVSSCDEAYEQVLEKYLHHE